MNYKIYNNAGNIFIPKNLFDQLTIAVFFLLISLCLFTSCSLLFKSATPDYEEVFPFPDSPIQPLTESDRSLIFEDEGKIAVYHGFGCAESKRDGVEDFIRIRESMNTLPGYVTAATVFLNGWELKYLKNDHEVRALATGITNIAYSGRTLSWEAGGILTDKNFDDSYGLCYYYTIIAWNQTEINALIDHRDEGRIFLNEEKHTTALKASPNYIQNANFAAGDKVVILPRGFGFDWLNDHNLFQVAYNLDYAEQFIQDGKSYFGAIPPDIPTAAGYVESGFVSWDSKTILKDNKFRYHYITAEIVSALFGRDVGFIQPPFTILPREDYQSGFFEGTITGGGISEREDEYVIENIPYTYAIPVLTGWELFYDVEDEHVTKMGQWISSFQYDKSATEPTGTLRYTLSSVLKDKNDEPGHSATHRISVLGIKPVIGAGLPTIAILNPSESSKHGSEIMITLQGEGFDPEDGLLSGSALAWYSDRDDFLGYGATIQIQLSGPDTPCNPDFVTHQITLRGIDSDGNQVIQKLTIRVGTVC